MKPSPQHTNTIIEPLTVVMRIRPMNSTEHRAGAKTIVHTVDEKLIVLMDPHDDLEDILRVNRSREKHYVFDHTFSSEASQEEVYCAVVQEKGIIESVLSGYNCTVFAYGATGTGKTHTMLGSQEQPGIMVHTLNSLFRRMEETKEDTEYQVSMGYLEIYNECVRDLLCPDSGSLELREDASGSITVSNLLDISASSTDVILGMLRMGNTNRTSEPTVANKTSSRSHAILKVNVEQRSRVSNVSQEVRSGSLYMVDLAGSERAAVTQNRGKRMIEGAHINRSLLALANCINALGSSNTNYINYRDSKLTRILKEALGGNCKTVMIAHASPASTSYEETRNTMVYADRSKKIKNKTRQNVVDVNHHVTQYLHIIDELQFQVIRLKAELDKAATAGPAESSEVRDLCEELRGLVRDQKDIRHKLLELECELLQNALKHQKHSACIREWEEKRDSASNHHTTCVAPTFAPASPLFLPSANTPAETLTDTDPLTDTEGPVTDEEAMQTSEGVPKAPLRSFLDHTPSKTRLNDKAGSTLSLKEAGRVASISELASVVFSGKKACEEEDSLSRGEDEVGAGGCVADPQSGGEEDNMCEEDPLSGGEEEVVMRTVKPKASEGFPKDLLYPISPDSGTEMSVTAPAETDRVEMEPVGVSRAREAVATLAAAKQRLETEHKRVERGLRENRTRVAQVREKLSESSGFLPVRRDMVDLLQHTSDLESSQIEHSLSSMLVGIHLSRHTSLLERLLAHSASLLGLLEQQHHRNTLPTEGGSKEGDVPDQPTCGQLLDKQRRLEEEVAELKTLPVLGSSLQLPSISRLSAKLYTTMTGSKSNLISDEGLSDHEQASASFSCPDSFRFSEGHLPSLLPSKHPTVSKKALPSNSIPTSISLPPIPSNSGYPAETRKTTEQLISLPSPLKQSEIAQILEAAKRSRDDRMAGGGAGGGGLGADRFGKARRNSIKLPTVSRKVPTMTFASPKSSLTMGRDRQKHVSPRRGAAFQHKVSAVQNGLTAKHGGSTEIIDLETTDTGESSERDAQYQMTPALSLQGQNTRSQPHLSTTTADTSPSTKKNTRPSQNHEGLRRSRSHARIASLPFPTPAAPLDEQVQLHQDTSASMEDTSSSKESVPAQREEKRPPPAPEKKATNASRPIVRKLTYTKLQGTSTKQSQKVHSVYGGRPYVIPMAKRIVKSPYPLHQAGGSGARKKRMPLHQYPRTKRKHPLSQKQELSLAKVRPGGELSFASPYIKQGGNKTTTASNSVTNKTMRRTNANVM